MLYRQILFGTFATKMDSVAPNPSKSSITAVATQFSRVAATSTATPLGQTTCRTSHARDEAGGAARACAAQIGKHTHTHKIHAQNILFILLLL